MEAFQTLKMMNLEEDLKMINLTINNVIKQLEKGNISVAKQMLLHIQEKTNN